MRRKRPISPIVGLLSVLGLLSPAPAPAQGATPPAPDVDTLRLTAVPEKAKRVQCKIRVGAGGSRRASSFSATEVLDLEFEIRLDHVRGDRLLRLDLFTPNGHLYQNLTVPFTTGTSKARVTRRVDGYARPLPVQTAVEVGLEDFEKGGDDSDSEDDSDSDSDSDSEDDSDSGRLAVTARLPVAGTSIVHSSLYGEWTARAFLDDRSEPCGRARAFRIEP